MGQARGIIFEEILVDREKNYDQPSFIGIRASIFGEALFHGISNPCRQTPCWE
jgi:hypothetical protein